jgi:hypothetical protein
MASRNLTGAQLLPSATDEQWLTLLDERYQFGIDVLAPAGGSYSAGARTRVFRASYLDPFGGLRAPCIVKLGSRDSITADYEGWLNFASQQPNRDAFARVETPVCADFGAALVTDLIGVTNEEIQPLSTLASSGCVVPPVIVRRLLERTLRPLHEAAMGPGGRLERITLGIGELLTNWITDALVTRISEILTRDPKLETTWQQEIIQEALLAVPTTNTLLDWMRGAPMPWTAREAAMPRGAIHGDPNLSNIYISRAGNPSESAIALIDFEYCAAGEFDSPYDDLTRLECELLLGQPCEHRRLIIAEFTFQQDLVPRGIPLAAAAPREKLVHQAIANVRTRALELGEATNGWEPRAFLRGYLGTLLGRLLRYLTYDLRPDVDRADIVLWCQLVAMSLADDQLAAAKPRIEPLARHWTRGGGDIARFAQGGWVFDATGRGAYAGLLLEATNPEQVGWHLEASFAIRQIAASAWMGFAIGAATDNPEASGLHVVLAVATSGARLSVLSHEDSRHATHTLTDLALDSRQLRIRAVVTLRGVTVKLTGAASGEPSHDIALDVPMMRYKGSLAFLVHGLKLHLLDLAVRALEC